MWSIVGSYLVWYSIDHIVAMRTRLCLGLPSWRRIIESNRMLNERLVIKVMETHVQTGINMKKEGNG